MKGQEEFNNMDSKFVMVDKSILPDYFEKVIQAKRLLETGEAKNVAEASRISGISRSTYYKYKDSVMTVSQDEITRRASISMMLDRRTGVLIDILNYLKECSCNIWTINQSMPIADVSNLVMTVELLDACVSVDEIIDKLRVTDGIFKVRLMGVE